MAYTTVAIATTPENRRLNAPELLFRNVRKSAMVDDG